MNHRIRAAYARVVPILRRALAEGSTVRALLLAIPGGAAWKGWIEPDLFPLWMFVASLLAALIPDDLSRGEP